MENSSVPDISQVDLSINAFTKAIAYTEYPASKASSNNVLRCFYFKIGSVNGQTWTCPPGYFCLTKETKDNPKVRCPKGFLCPENSQQPTYCCKGWYCPNSTIAIPCPKGKWCPRGSVKPQSCFGIGVNKTCPERTAQAPKFGLVWVFIGFFLLVGLFFAYRKRKIRIRNAKYNNLLQHMMEAKEDRPEAVSINKKKFDIEFENLGLILPNGVEIMKGVSGEFKAGRSCCIMGPSGAGKTTFVNLLTDKVKRTSGEVRINGKKESLKKYKKLIGFVPQEDVMLRELTVQDILVHSAYMRLPTSWTREQKKEKVLEVVHFLELDHVINNPIGNEEERGISGGQRKRVNIGMELVADPNILFLDEPTSGLDSSTAYEVCSLLSEIARKQNMTIVSVIHSPSAQAFRQFDDLLLLGKGGRVVYFGPINKASQYFERIGFPCPPNENPADFFMDVTSGKIPSSLKADFKPSDLFDYWDLYNVNKDDETFKIFISSRTKYDLFKKTHLPKSASEVKVNPVMAFFDIFRDWFYYVVDILEELWSNILGFFRYIYVIFHNLFICCIKDATRIEFDPIRSTPNVFTVFWLDFKRACLQIYRSLKSFLLDQVLHLGCGLFISIASQDFTYLPQQPKEICNVAPLNLRNICNEPFDYITFAGIFVSLGVLFSGMSVGSGTFGNEKVVFWRDTSAGQPTISYYIAKVVADIPRVVFAAIMFTIAFITLFPYHSTYMNIFFIVLALYACAFSMGYFLSVIFNKKIVALASTGFSLAWSLVLSGIIPNLKDINGGIIKHFKFLWNISAPRWAIELFWLREVQAREFELDVNNLPNTYKTTTDPVGFLYIIYITIGWNVLSYLAMKLLHRQHQK